MGTTLTNGVYLPNEGERNCYAGLKTNWEILDQKVADVTALQQAVAGALHREIVESLPTTDIDLNTIYMILSGTSATENVYNEFMYVNNAWELIGTSATDLTNYYTKAEVDGKLLLKASASDLTSHTGDTDIHVTANDKAKWTNSANTVVLRLAKTALTPSSSTNSFSNLDDSTALKVGDKVMDTAGVLFEVTAIDTANSTFTIGTALIDLAQDSDVVHKSGSERITDTKTFGNGTLIVDNSTVSNVHGEIKLQGSRLGYIVADHSSDGVFDNANCGISILLQDSGKPFHVGSYKVDSNGRVFANNTNKNPVLTVMGNLVKTSMLVPDGDTSNNVFRILSEITYANGNPSKVLDVRFQQYDNVNATSAIYSYDDGKTSLGALTKRWSGVYSTNYYYGNDNVEFSNKFVTTDTTQTISGTKTFSNDLTIYNSDTTAYASYLNLKNQKDVRGSTTDTGVQGIQYQDKNSKTLTMLESRVISNGNTGFNIICYNLDGNNQTVSDGVSIIKTPITTNFAPTTDNAVTCGRALARWSDVQTYKVNSLEPSSLGMPSDRSTRVDISSYFTNTATGDTNSYTVPANGYIYLTLSELTNVHCFSRTLGNVTNYAQTFTKLSNSTGVLYVLFPVRKNDVFVTTWYTTTTVSVDGAYFIPCQGNV